MCWPVPILASRTFSSVVLQLAFIDHVAEIIMTRFFRIVRPERKGALIIFEGLPSLFPQSYKSIDVRFSCATAVFWSVGKVCYLDAL